MAKIIAAAEPDYGLLNRFAGTSIIPASERGHDDYVAWAVDDTSIELDDDRKPGGRALLEASSSARGRGAGRRSATLLEAGADSTADKDGATPLSMPAGQVTSK